MAICARQRHRVKAALSTLYWVPVSKSEKYSGRFNFGGYAVYRALRSASLSRWALAVVETIESQQGSDGIIRPLEAQRTESSQEAALRQGLRMNFSELDDATAAYLKKIYSQ